jgi:hypothetical protein
MLPATLNEALGITLSEVMDHYFDGLDEAERVHTLDRRRTFEEGEEWLAGEACRMSAMLERVHQGQSDDSF